MMMMLFLLLLMMMMISLVVIIVAVTANNVITSIIISNSSISISSSWYCNMKYLYHMVLIKYFQNNLFEDNQNWILQNK